MSPAATPPHAPPSAAVIAHRREVVVASLVRLLGPFIGDAMVRASAAGHWDKLALGAEADEAGVDRLLAAIGPGLNVFVGRRRGELLMQEVAGAIRDASMQGRR